jgi:hypothetical protein
MTLPVIDRGRYGRPTCGRSTEELKSHPTLRSKRKIYSVMYDEGLLVQRVFMYSFCIIIGIIRFPVQTNWGMQLSYYTFKEAQIFGIHVASTMLTHVYAGLSL